MPVANYDAAIDELYAILNNGWGESQAIVGYVPEIRWQGVQNSAPESQDQFWIRPAFKTVNRSQSSLQVINGNHRFTVVGLFIVQLVSPKGTDDVASKLRQLAELVRSLYKTESPSGIWFRRPIIREIDPDDTNYYCNFTVTCTWDEIN